MGKKPQYPLIKALKDLPTEHDFRPTPRHLRFLREMLIRPEADILAIAKYARIPDEVVRSWYADPRFLAWKTECEANTDQFWVDEMWRIIRQQGIQGDFRSQEMWLRHKDPAVIKRTSRAALEEPRAAAQINVLVTVGEPDGADGQKAAKLIEVTTSPPREEDQEMETLAEEPPPGAPSE